MIRAGTVYLVGAGPGDPGLITRRGLEILRGADVIVHDRLASSELLLEAKTDAKLIYVGKAASSHALTQEEINRLLAQEAKAGRSVCRLKGGDPFLFGRGGEEAEYLVEEGVQFEVVPGVTSALAVPAYAGIPVTDRRWASSVAIATGHEQAEKDRGPVNWARLARAADTIVVLMGMKNLTEIIRELVAGGRDPATPAAVIRWGTTGQQRTLISTLFRVAEEAERKGFSAPAILVVGDVVAMSQRLDWCQRRPLRGLRVLVTRPRHQASVLAERLREAGAEPVVCSLLRLQSVPVEESHLRALLSQAWDWVIFTSANGVSCFSEQIRKVGLDWRALAGARLAAMGPGTRSALEQFGLSTEFVPSRAVAEALAEELPGVGPGTRVLLPRAAEAREALPELLQARGASVEQLATYRTVADREGASFLRSALEQKEFNVITFTSSSGVRAFVELIGRELLGGVSVACIGPITAATARKCGLTVEVEAKEHTIPGLVAALEAYAAERRSAHEGTRA